MSVGQNSYFSEFTFQAKSKIGPLFPPRASSKSRPSLVRPLNKEACSLERSASSVNYDQFKGKQNKLKSFANLSQQESVKSSLFNELEVVQGKPAKQVNTPQRPALAQKNPFSYQNNSQIKPNINRSRQRRYAIIKTPSPIVRPQFRNRSPPTQTIRIRSHFHHLQHTRFAQYSACMPAQPSRYSRSRSPFLGIKHGPLPPRFMPLNSEYFGGLARAKYSLRREHCRSLSLICGRFEQSRRGVSGMRLQRPRFF